MRVVATLGLGIMLAVSGCGSRADTSGPRQRPNRPATTPPRSPSDGHPAADPPPSTDPPPAAAAPSEVRVVGAPSSSEVAISVTNASDGPVQLAKALVVETAHGSSWSELQGVGELALRSDCQTAAPACLTLVSGATLEPPAWLGTVGDAQCACERCGPAPVGRYRFVAHTCSGARIEGAPFELTR